jgi:hypothetical protein
MKRLLTIVALGAGLLALLLPGSASAASARAPGDAGEVAAGITLRASAGVGGWVAPGHAFPVTVSVKTDRLVKGTLVVTNGSTVLSREVEVAGGNTARFRFLAPPDAGDPFGDPAAVGTVQARLVVDGDSAGKVDADYDMNPDRELVGVLPEALAASGPRGSLPNGIALAAGGDEFETARPVAVDLDLLSMGALALGPLDQVVAQPDEVAALSRKQRDALTRWVEAGGQLLLTGDAPDAAEGALPKRWVPEPGHGVRAGLGRVRSVPGDWREQLMPSPVRTTSEQNGLVITGVGANDTIGGRLSDDAGVRLPSGVRLAIMLVLYVVVAGPLAYLLVRRIGRRQLAWAAIPLLAITSTGVVVGAGGSLRRASQSAHVTIYETGPGGTTATTWSLLSRPRDKGDVGVRLPDGWSAAADVTQLMTDQVSPVRVTTTADGLEATTRPPTGGFGLIRSQGPAAGMKDALVVTATTEADGTITGTVRNKLAVTLEHVAVFAGGAGVADVGTLEPGQRRNYEIDDATAAAGIGADPEHQVWPDPVGTFGGVDIINKGGIVIKRRARVGRDGSVSVEVESGAPAPGAGGGSAGGESADAGQQPPVVKPPPLPGDDGPVQIDPGPGFPDRRMGGGEDVVDDTPVVMAAWAALMEQSGANYRPTGQVVAAGWTEELDPPVGTIGSGKVARSRSAVVARATASPAGDRLTDAATVQSVVKTSEGGIDPAVGFDPTAIDKVVPEMTTVSSFDLPASVGDRPVDAGRLALRVPDGVEDVEVWTPQGWKPVTADLPAGAVIGDQVLVRWKLSLDSFSSGRDLVLYEKEA